MTSVYFPAHVFILFRRLVNVVSTLSISNHYISYSRQDDVPPTVSSKDASHLPRPPQAAWNLDWPWCTIRTTCDRALSDTIFEIRNLYSQGPVKGNWSGTWPRLFSFQPQLDGPPPESDPPPKKHGKEELKREGDEKSRLKESNDRPQHTASTERSHHTQPLPVDTIHQLLANPLLYDPLRTPRFPIVLCHGLYGFDSRGPTSFPSLRMHYWSNVLRILRGKVGAEVIVTSVPGTGSITSRATSLDEQLRGRVRGRGINFLAHSMGGLDCRHLISHIRPNAYVPLSLLTIGTPHRGSPFMDWCASNIGIGKLRQQEKELKEELRRSSQKNLHLSEDEDDVMTSSDLRFPSIPTSSTKSSSSSFSLTSLPTSFTTLLLSIVDSPAYANLTSHYLNQVFNPATPDDPRVKYWSVAGRVSAGSVSVWHPFWLPKMVLDGRVEAERDAARRVWLQERERMRWEEGGKDGEIPLWADEREWGNDGLVSVQSAKWGEFLGIMEGCDHWEMRGSRGIEFGVDLPALPAFGLGEAPHPTSTCDRPVVGPTSAQTQAQGDGWGFRDWTRFVSAWKKSKEEDAAAAVTRPSAQNKSEVEKKAEGDRGPRREASGEQHERERKKDEDEHVMPRADASTDKMSTSVVFDWLVERVPAVGKPTGPVAITPLGNEKREAESTEMETEKGVEETRGKVREAGAEGDRALHEAAVTYTVGAGVGLKSSSSSSHGQNYPERLSEMKRHMNRESKGREKKRELATREDLERFYVALARKMYDEGL